MTKDRALLIIAPLRSVHAGEYATPLTRNDSAVEPPNGYADDGPLVATTTINWEGISWTLSGDWTHGVFSSGSLWAAPRPLVAGGQGRSAEDVEEAASRCLAVVAGALVLAGILCTAWCLS